MTRSIIVGLLVAAACGKTVPRATTGAPAVATTDAPVNDPGCNTPRHDGEPCTSPGLVCTSPAPCGVDTSTCLLGFWSTVPCANTTEHCPCLSNANCDPLSQCAADGICQGLLNTTGCGTA